MQQSATKRAGLVASCLSEVRDELERLTNGRAGGVRIYSDGLKDTSGNLVALHVDVAKMPRWLARPFATLRVNAYPSEPNLPATPSASLVWPEGESSMAKTLRDSMNQVQGTGVPGVVDRVKVIAAECINRHTEVDYATPRWYQAVGTVLAWPIALLVYLVLALSGGFMGALLGWIPACIAFFVSRLLWLPALLALGVFVALT